MSLPDVVECPERRTVFVLTEPPYAQEPHDETRGRLLRVFERDAGRRVPLDA
jgi:hypothetical protein